jgi:predicted nucleic acid-binding protein
MRRDGILVDASALIYLAKADAFREAYLSVGAMLIAPAVWQEAVEAGIRRGVADPQTILSAQGAGWLRTIPIPPRVERLARALAERHRIGQGESQVLAIARRETRVVIDDLRASRVAVALGYLPVPTVFLPIIGMRERGLPRQSAAQMLRRLAGVVTLSAGQMVQLETLLGERS